MDARPTNSSVTDFPGNPQYRVCPQPEPVECEKQADRKKPPPNLDLAPPQNPNPLEELNSAPMTVKVGYAVDIKEDIDETIASQSSSAFPTCIIRLAVRYRYQLRFASNEGKFVVLEDVVTPELSAALRVPLVFPLSLWQELYLADALKKSNLIEPGIRAMLQRKIAESAETMSKGKLGSSGGGGGGFAMVVKVGILKDEILSTEERDRIACGLLTRDHGGNEPNRTGISD